MDFSFDEQIDGFLKKERDETKVQELIFRKPKYNEEKATQWAKERKYVVNKTRESDVTYRIVQAPEGEFLKHTFKVVRLDDGVDAVIGRKRDNR